MLQWKIPFPESKLIQLHPVNLQLWTLKKLTNPGPIPLKRRLSLRGAQHDQTRSLWPRRLCTSTNNNAKRWSKLYPNTHHACVYGISFGLVFIHLSGWEVCMTRCGACWHARHVYILKTYVNTVCSVYIYIYTLHCIANVGPASTLKS